MADRKRSLWLTSALLAFGTLASCTVAVDAAPPQHDLPPLAATTAVDLTEWWHQFADAQLDALVVSTHNHNQDLRAAIARVEQAGALVRATEDLLPLANVRAGAGRSQTSDNNAFPRFAGIDRRNNALSLALDVTYELDLWGRIRAADRAALADLAANQEAMWAVHSALAAETAHAYFRLVAFDRRLALLRATLGNREEAVRIQRRRLAAGTGTALELHQAEADRAAVASTLPNVEAAVASTERALLVLTGASPRQIEARQVARTQQLPAPPAVPIGLPSDLLQRRPDVRQAEQQLAAAAARVSEARARYFPTIRLTGSLGQESKDLGDLFLPTSTIWNLAAGLTQPLFGLRKIDAQVSAAEAAREMAEATYVRTVQGAFAETYDALGTLGATTATLSAQAERTAALAASERIAEARHSAGAGAFLDLLDASRNLLSVQNEQIDTQLLSLTATIDVFRALGGGFPSSIEP